MSKPKFYQAKLEEVKENVLDHVYPRLKGKDQLTLKERMGSEEAQCYKCRKNHWMLFPKEHPYVKHGEKPYMQCLECGEITHL